ncbi:MAG: tautomerase family protein [Candidatus Diapherotrites archaeon]|nr:tautomerase family protein [Candidatus Diapherotrites archaeon]
MACCEKSWLRKMNGGKKMPVVKIDLLEGRSAEQKEKLAKALLKAFEENDVPKEWVTIVFNDNPVENWVVGGEMLAEKLKKEK